MSARPLLMPINPALLKHADQHRQHLENRIADQITRFAGAMLFVYLHIGVCVQNCQQSASNQASRRHSQHRVASLRSECWAAVI